MEVPPYVKAAAAAAIDARRAWVRPECQADPPQRHAAQDAFAQAKRSLHAAVDHWVREAVEEIEKVES